jgi:1,4-dihydroxy-2-naphthoyl-CoA hydrolase
MPTFKATLDELNALNPNTLAESLGIEFTEIGENFIRAKMPVDHRTVQPYGILHGGASVALAETLGSVAAQITVGFDRPCVGVEINANHLKSVTTGFVHGTAKPIRLGKNVHVWNIEILDDQENLICVSRLTVLIKAKKPS